MTLSLLEKYVEPSEDLSIETLIESLPDDTSFLEEEGALIAAIESLLTTIEPVFDVSAEDINNNELSVSIESAAAVVAAIVGAIVALITWFIKKMSDKRANARNLVKQSEKTQKYIVDVFKDLAKAEREMADLQKADPQLDALFESAEKFLESKMKYAVVNDPDKVMLGLFTQAVAKALYGDLLTTVKTSSSVLEGIRSRGIQKDTAKEIQRQQEALIKHAQTAASTLDAGKIAKPSKENPLPETVSAISDHFSKLKGDNYVAFRSSKDVVDFWSKKVNSLSTKIDDSSLDAHQNKSTLSQLEEINDALDKYDLNKIDMSYDPDDEKKKGATEAAIKKTIQSHITAIKECVQAMVTVGKFRTQLVMTEAAEIKKAGGLAKKLMTFEEFDEWMKTK